MIQQSGNVGGIDRAGGFQLDQDCSFYEEIRPKGADPSTTEPGVKLDLGFDDQPGVLKGNRHR
jgi:hypothetical protein